MSFPDYNAVCPAGVYQKKFSMTGLSGQVRPGDLAREMEKITEEHLCSLGMSRSELKAEGKIWVIAWSQIRIFRLPTLDEDVILQIWPGKMKTMMHVRKYAFYTADGEPLACAASLFVLMDTNTRSFAEHDVKDIPTVELPKEPSLPPMRMRFPAALEGTLSRTVAAEEIDLNGHLNNTHYLDWVDGLLGDRRPASIWIQYIKELTEGQNVVLHFGSQDGMLYVRGSADDADSFLLTVNF